MIVTVTMNPSVDISYSLNTLTIDDINRVEETSKTAGGKGLNVTRVLKQLGADVLATGILGGYLGEFIEEQLKNEEINSDFLKIDKETRNCIAILHEGNQTEVLEAGPKLSLNEGERFLNLFESIIKNKEVVAISGSLPKGLPTNYYNKLIKIAETTGTKVLLDTSGTTLKESISSKEKPYLIKPNINELSALFGLEITYDVEILIKVLSNHIFENIEVIVVSLGAEGAFVKIRENYYEVSIPKINAVSAVGSGDATIAGLALGVQRGSSWEETLKLGMTTGILNTMEKKTGYINKKNFEEIYNEVKVININ